MNKFKKKINAQLVRTKMKIRKGDMVKVMAGQHKGFIGQVIECDLYKRAVKVKDCNFKHHYVKKDTDPTSQRESGILTSEGWISVNNVMLYDEQSGIASRAGLRFEDGKKVLFLKKNNKVLRVIKNV